MAYELSISMIIHTNKCVFVTLRKLSMPEVPFTVNAILSQTKVVNVLCKKKRHYGRWQHFYYYYYFDNLYIL